MTISPELRDQVRERANFACEFCGVSERDSGGELTVDHFRPASKGGTDDLANLIYCCVRCNQYKLDYWPSLPTDLPLWNPRTESVAQHFLLLEDGKLHALTETGEFTLRRLRLNRAPLVAYRYRKLYEAEEVRLLTRYGELVELLERLLEQQAALMQEQRDLLEEHRGLLQLLLTRRRGT